MTAQNIMQDMMYNEIVKQHEKKSKRVLINKRIKELIAQGVDPVIAKTMANVEWKYNL